MSVKIDGNGFISGLAPMGSCRLGKSGTNLLLSRWNGNQLFINGENRPIPAAGVTLAQAGLTASAVNYVYAAWTGSAIVLEAAAAAGVTETTYGTKVKTGDATRALVGMCYPKAGPTLTDTLAARLVLSWFNKQDLDLLVPFPNPTTSASTTPGTEISAAARIEFLTWAGELVEGGCSGWMFNGGAVGNIIQTGYSWDGTTTPEGLALGNTPAAGAIASAALSVKTALLSEGYHYGTVTGYSQAGTGNWNNSSAVGGRTVNIGKVRG